MYFLLESEFREPVPLLVTLFVQRSPSWDIYEFLPWAQYEFQAIQCNHHKTRLTYDSNIPGEGPEGLSA